MESDKVMDIFNSELLYRIVCILSAAAYTVVGVSLIRTVGVMKKISGVFPEDMIPHRYLAMRRVLGCVYIFTGICILLAVPQLPEFLSPGDFGSFQFLIVTSALLSLYGSPLAGRRIVFLNAGIFILLYVIFWNYPVVKSAVFLVQMTVYTVVFFMERRRYLRTMAERMGTEEAQYYSRKGIAVCFVLSLALAIWSGTSFFFPTLGCVSLFIAACTIYYVFLGIYIHNQWEAGAIVQEIISENQ